MGKIYGEADVELGKIVINLANWVGKQKSKNTISFANGFFELNLRISIVGLTEGPDIDVNPAVVLRNEEPDKLKHISRETWEIIRAQKMIFE